MTHELISRIWIDEDGTLCIQPKTRSFELIFRSAMGVRWSALNRCLHPVSAGSVSPLEWYRHILVAVEAEYGCVLHASNETVFENIDRVFQLSILSAIDIGKKSTDDYLTEIFRKGFPSAISFDVELVLSFVMRNKTYNDCPPISSDMVSYTVEDEDISFPYRIYYKESAYIETVSFTRIQALIYNCLFSRNCDGYVRQRHIENLLSGSDIPSWCLPYIIKVSDEYVKDIIVRISDGIFEIDTNMLSAFINSNILAIRLGNTRMISYWDCYYRKEYGDIKEYVGYKLFNYLKSFIDTVPLGKNSPASPA